MNTTSRERLRRFNLRALQVLFLPLLVRAIKGQASLNRSRRVGIGITYDDLRGKTHTVAFLLKDGMPEFTFCQAPITSHVRPSVEGVEVDCKWCRFLMNHTDLDIPAGSHA